jgi:mono/diheme cytochrome c family protein
VEPEDLQRALREGVARDGRHLFPAFPYTFYTRLTDRDIADLYAYLRTLKPVRYVPPENDRAFRIRWPMATWKALNLEPGAYRPDPAQSAEWNRGAYLVQGPGHCGACHTPRDWSLAEQAADPLRGAVMRDEVKGGGVRDWFAVDLRATAQGLAGWKAEHIVDYLAKGASARAGSFGPMNAVIANSTSRLRAEDLRAIAVYLRSLEGPDYAGNVAATEDGKAGAPLYERHCRECHGPSGRGGPFDGPPLAGSAIVQGESAASLLNVVLHGSDRHEGIGSPAWRRCPRTRMRWTTRSSPRSPTTCARAGAIAQRRSRRPTSRASAQP